MAARQNTNGKSETPTLSCLQLTPGVADSETIYAFSRLSNPPVDPKTLIKNSLIKVDIQKLLAICKMYLLLKPRINIVHANPSFKKTLLLSVFIWLKKCEHFSIKYTIARGEIPTVPKFSYINITLHNGVDKNLPRILNSYINAIDTITVTIYQLNHNRIYI